MNKGRKGRKERAGHEDEHGAFVIDKIGRRHPRGEAWKLARQQQEAAAARARSPVRRREEASSSSGVATRRRPDAAATALVLKASKADAAASSAANDRRMFRGLLKDASEEKEALQKALDKHSSKVAGMHNHAERLRAREADALDAKKEAEVTASRHLRAMEELRLQLVAAEAQRDAAQLKTRAAHDALACAERDAAACRASSELNEAKAAALRRRVAQLAGRLGGEHSTKRTADVVALMPTDDAAARNRRRKAKHDVVRDLAAAISTAKDQPKILADALCKVGALNTIVKKTKDGQDMLFSHGKQLAKSLTDVWDTELSTEFKVDLGLTDWQMNELRFKLCYEWNENRWVKRKWFEHPVTNEIVYFPQPVVSQKRWRPRFIELCSKHKLELTGTGAVAQRGFKQALALLLHRCDALLPPAAQVTAAQPLVVSLGWDALRHAGRHITHGGMKLATFGKQAVSTSSELNFVSTNVFRDNDDHYGLVRGLRGWVPALNAAKRLKTFGRETAPDEPAPDALAVGGAAARAETAAASQEDAQIKSLPRAQYDIDFAATLDLSAMRSISNRAKGCASHCECDDGDPALRNQALHDWPDVNGDESWPAIKRLLSARCKILTKERRMRISHFVRPGHDWRQPATCDCCDWRVSKAQYEKELNELLQLVKAAKINKAARMKLDSLKTAHRKTHLKSEYMHEDLLEEFDSIEFVADMMHGMPLNIAKILFKYSFLDVLTETEQREELAEFLHSIDCPFDCRLESESGWMRASAMQAFECGSAKSPGLGPNIMRLCDMAYGFEAAEARAPQPPPQAESSPPPPQQQPSAPVAPVAPAKRGRNVEEVRRPARKPTRARPAAAALPTPIGGLPRANAVPPAPAASVLRPDGVDDATWEMLVGRYAEHAATVHAIMSAWELYHDLSNLLATPLDDTSLAGRQEKARQVALASIAFAHRFESVCSGRHRSWYLHLFVYIVPRQIERYGDLWPFSTAALEGRGARIKRVRVCWRGYSDKPMICKAERQGRVTSFKRSYRSAPTIQILRMITAAEELYHDGKGRGASRLKNTGRFKKVKIEADHSSTDTYEMDPFKALSSFLADVNVVSGSDL